MVVPISGAMDENKLYHEQLRWNTLYHDSIRRDVGDQLGIKLTELALGEQLRSTRVYVCNEYDRLSTPPRDEKMPQTRLRQQRRSLATKFRSGLW